MSPLAIPVNQAAEQLHCSRRKVFELLANGTLRRVRIGRKTLVGTESIEALLAPPPMPARRATRRTSTGYQPFTRADVRHA